MNENDNELKTIAILTGQSPLALGNDEHVHRLAETLSLRLQHPVLVIQTNQAEGIVDALESVINPYYQQGYRRCVLLPIGLEALDPEDIYSVVVWLRSEKIGIHLHVGRSWSLRDIAEAIGPTIMEATRAETKNAVLLLADHQSDVKVGLELAELAFHLQQSNEEMEVHFTFLDRTHPSLPKVLRRMDSSNVQSVSLITWRMDSEQSMMALRKFGTLHERDLFPGPFEYAWQWNRLSNESPRPMRHLETSSWMHVAMAIYFEALSARSRERYFSLTPISTHASDIKIANALAEVDSKVDAMLPSEYRDRLDEVSPKSMGSASCNSDSFGVIAWDEIWTSFCDLAMAGGPPHRGRLLEAITEEQAKEDLSAYDAVVREIRRGIEMVTGLSTRQASVLGWVAVQCDDEAMAVWLMRAIIVENVMVRREGATLFLPAGPTFRVRGEIKNVITSVAKTVHYWRAHLRCR